MQISEPWPSLSSHRRPFVPHIAASAAAKSRTVGRLSVSVVSPLSRDSSVCGPCQWKSFLYSTGCGIFSVNAAILCTPTDRAARQRCCVAFEFAILACSLKAAACIFWRCRRSAGSWHLRKPKVLSQPSETEAIGDDLGASRDGSCSSRSA